MRLLKTLSVAAVFGAILFGVWSWTISNGRKAVGALAKEYGYCQDEDCAGGVAALEAEIGRQKNVSPTMIEWCVGVDDWAEARVARGGFIKSIIVETMYMPCGALRSEEPNG